MYWYGSYDPGYGIYTPGNALSMRFVTNEADPGFQLVYYQLDIGTVTCDQLKQQK